MRSKRALTAIAAAAMTIAACGGADEQTDVDAGNNEGQISVDHAFGTTTLDEAPERVATVNWSNHEVPLALGVVPVGMAEASYGTEDGSDVLPWVGEQLDALDAETPVLFDEDDGIDFAAVADTEPDVILAAYSGLTQEDYDTLSEIAPVIAYPEGPWTSDWRDTIAQNSAGMGMAEEGQQLIADIDDEIDAALAEYPELEGASAMFMSHVDPTDLSEIGFYTAQDTRTQFFEDLGMTVPASIEEVSTNDDEFFGTISAEQVDRFDDVDVIVTYGEDDVVSTLEQDPLLSLMPAVADGAIVNLPDGPLGAAANPSPLAVSWMLDEYLPRLAEAATK